MKQLKKVKWVNWLDNFYLIRSNGEVVVALKIIKFKKTKKQQQSFLTIFE